METIGVFRRLKNLVGISGNFRCNYLPRDAFPTMWETFLRCGKLSCEEGNLEIRSNMNQFVSALDDLSSVAEVAREGEQMPLNARGHERQRDSNEG